MAPQKSKRKLTPRIPVKEGAIARRDRLHRKWYADNREAALLAGAMGIRIAEARQILAALPPARPALVALDRTTEGQTDAR